MAKKLQILCSVILLIVLSWNLPAQQRNYMPYKDPKLSPERRSKDLLKRMSIDDKVNQLMAVIDGSPDKYDREFLADTLNMRRVFGKGVNSVQPSFSKIKETVESRNKIQKYLHEKTRWGIPALFVDEGQHGLMKPEATSFPMAIGLACSWDTDLFEKVYTVAAAEMRSRGTHHVLSPVIDVCRDPRWGRVEETYGEDPYLNGILGIAAVKGFQGTLNGIILTGHVAATLKHFCGHGQPEGGLNQAPANYSERVLREFHMPPFKMVIERAKPLAVMPSYNEIDGIPSHNNPWLLKEVLRREWGFKGMIVSDYAGINELLDKHFVAKDSTDAAMKAFNSGVQSEFQRGTFYKFLPRLLKEGKIKMADIDSAVYRVLHLKFQLGLFENPFVDEENAVRISKDPHSRELALKAARESIVLLKNQDNFLPLDRNKYKKIAVIGPGANHVFLGGYSGEPYQKVSILEGIKSKVGANISVLFAQGCKLVNNVGISHQNWSDDKIDFTSHEENQRFIEEAANLARQSEMVVLTLGETEQLCREAWSKEHIGDSQSLDLFGDQDALVKAIAATGKPVIIYLMNGRPLSVNYISKNFPVIIEGWYMGQETGTAVADIIFGDVNPSGKLTITIPRSGGQLPMFYNHKPSAQFQNYVSQEVTPLYPFGYGLSYTTFSYKNFNLSAEKIKMGEKSEASVEITNTGRMKGDEIVQLYIRDKVSSVTRPVIELKGFQRLTLEPGETRVVKFMIDSDKLAFWNSEMKYVVESGEFDIMIGKSSTEVDKKTLTVQ